MILEKDRILDEIVNNWKQFQNHGGKKSTRILKFEK